MRDRHEKSCPSRIRRRLNVSTDTPAPRAVASGAIAGTRFSSLIDWGTRYDKYRKVIP